MLDIQPLLHTRSRAARSSFKPTHPPTPTGKGWLGNGQGPSTSSRPVAVAGARQFTTIAAQGDHACATQASGAAYCWGSGAMGQLGDGTEADATSPVLVQGGGLRFGAICAGSTHTCALTQGEGEAHCWGMNDLGQLVSERPAGASAAAAAAVACGGASWRQHWRV